MSAPNLLYPFATVYATTDALLGINYRGRIHFFERAVLEAVTNGTRLWLIVTDCASGKPAQCLPLRDPVRDWRTYTGLETPEEIVDAMEEIG